MSANTVFPDSQSTSRGSEVREDFIRGTKWFKTSIATSHLLDKGRNNVEVRNVKRGKREEEEKSKSVTNFHMTKANSWRSKLLGSIESFAED